jgi:hypothetical protein
LNILVLPIALSFSASPLSRYSRYTNLLSYGSKLPHSLDEGLTIR